VIDRSRGWSSFSPKILGKNSGRSRPRKRFASVTVSGPPLLFISYDDEEHGSRSRTRSGLGIEMAVKMWGEMDASGVPVTGWSRVRPSRLGPNDE